jgi:hypothetical protein
MPSASRPKAARQAGDQVPGSMSWLRSARQAAAAGRAAGSDSGAVLRHRRSAHNRISTYAAVILAGNSALLDGG